MRRKPGGARLELTSNRVTLLPSTSNTGALRCLGVVSLLQDAHDHVDCQLCLESRLIGRRRHDRMAPDAAMDSRPEVIGDDLDVFRQPALAQHLHCGLRGDGRAYDVVDVLVPVEGRIDQPGLLVDARVAEPRLDDRNARPFHRVTEAVITRRHPPRSLRPREPSDADGLVGPARQSLEVVAGGESHVVEVCPHARGDGSGADSVDEVHNRDAAVGVDGNEIVQTVRRDGAQDHPLSAASDTFGDLSLLRLQILVAAGLEHVEAHAETCRFLDQSEVDRQPVVVLQVWD
jgi:hypothetical protein